jgi:hypothetical protein
VRPSLTPLSRCSKGNLQLLMLDTVWAGGIVHGVSRLALGMKHLVAQFGLTFILHVWVRNHLSSYLKTHLVFGLET